MAEDLREEFSEELGSDVYDAYLHLLETGKPIDYQLFSSAERYLGQAIFDILENGENVQIALSKAQETLNKKR